MSGCSEFDPLIAERASGGLEVTEDARRLAAHLETCERCRRELAAYEDALGAARLPPPSELDRQAFGSLATQALDALRSEPVATSGMRQLVAGMIAAAAIAVVGPSILSAWLISLGGSPEDPEAMQVASPAAEWREPDPELLLERVEREHAELAIATLASDEELTRAELIADAAFQRALADE